ncbi:group III truncated hemoglobin [Galbibacter pacificus]|uniref:Group III truncated hemoglobin n=1 Tax=Galbibacter pacificus TaxID=2996052 RepID=A0ABT6FVD9_9FLAO|nr:group III truncated hemoglobin [Galbibacter pacificus]MDG3583844.1 group III truncated hemoglobin [Galbibacter pacificus]MDG3587238.1 group III truncated hemoglobin [Galbibacter pacificus]
MKTDIQSIDDIKLLVDTFYGEIRKDPILSPIFNNVIQDQWPKHLEKMYRFWETVLSENHTYFGSPFAPHAKLPVSKEHFDRWKFLFFTTVDSLFIGEKASEAKWRAEKMAEMFQHKIAYLSKL